MSDIKHSDPGEKPEADTGIIDLRRNPYRGILAELAREQGVCRQAVQKRMRRGDPETLALLAVKIRERTKKMKRYKRALRIRDGVAAEA